MTRLRRKAYRRLGSRTEARAEAVVQACFLLSWWRVLPRLLSSSSRGGDRSCGCKGHSIPIGIHVPGDRVGLSFISGPFTFQSLGADASFFSFARHTCKPVPRFARFREEPARVR